MIMSSAVVFFGEARMPPEYQPFVLAIDIMNMRIFSERKYAVVVFDHLCNCAIKVIKITTDQFCEISYH